MPRLMFLLLLGLIVDEDVRSPFSDGVCPDSGINPCPMRVGVGGIVLRFNSRECRTSEASEVSNPAVEELILLNPRNLYRT